MIRYFTHVARAALSDLKLGSAVPLLESLASSYEAYYEQLALVTGSNESVVVLVRVLRAFLFFATPIDAHPGDLCFCSHIPPSYRQLSTMMRLVCFLLLLGSGAAFAPQPVFRSRVALRVRKECSEIPRFPSAFVSHSFHVTFLFRLPSRRFHLVISTVQKPESALSGHGGMKSMSLILWKASSRP